jgi:hypothetical protein
MTTRRRITKWGVREIADRANRLYGPGAWEYVDDIRRQYGDEEAEAAAYAVVDAFTTLMRCGRRRDDHRSYSASVCPSARVRRPSVVYRVSASQRERE